MRGEQEAEQFETMIGGVSAFSPTELVSAAGEWLASEEMGGFSSGTFLAGDADGRGDGRTRDRPGVVVTSEAKFLLEGVALYWHLEDEGEGFVELYTGLRRALVRRLWTRPALGSSCSGIYAKTGIACRAAVVAGGSTSACRRHKAQDLITALSRVIRAYPRFDSTAIICGGSEPPGPFVAYVVCSLCARGRPMEDCVTECAALGRADPGGDGASVFSHYPDWVSDAGPGRLDRPGFQFCLACAAEFSFSCQLVGFRAASEDACTDGAPLPKDATLGPRSLHV